MRAHLKKPTITADRTATPVAKSGTLIPIWVLVVLAILGALAIVYQNWQIPLYRHDWGLLANKVDMDVYRHGGLTIWSSQSLYDHPVLLGYMDFTYTPFSAVLFSVMAPFNLPTLHVIWMVASVFALTYTFYVIGRAFGYRSGWRQQGWRLWVAAAALTLIASLLEPIRTTFLYGQINLFLMATIIGDLLRPPGAKWRGWSVGLWAGIKLTPAFFMVYFVATRQWRELKNSIITLLITVVVGFIVIFSDSVTYWGGKFLDSDRVGPTTSPANQSLNGYLAQWMGRTPPLPLWLGLDIVALALGVAASVIAYRWGHTVWALLIASMTMTTVSPFSWGHHWVWLAPVCVVLAEYIRRSSSWSSRIGLLAGLIGVILASFMWIYYVDHPIAGQPWTEFYGIGAFLHPTTAWTKYFLHGPYLWVFVVAAIATTIVVPRVKRLPLDR